MDLIQRSFILDCSRCGCVAKQVQCSN